jgi:hypothetical protein
MRSGIRCGAFALLLGLLTGCGLKQPKTTVPQTAQVPDLPPARMVAILSPVPPPFPDLDRHPIKLDTTAPPEVKTEVAAEPPHKSPKHHGKPTPDEATKAPATPPTPVPQVATAQPSEQSPIGQLSANTDGVNTADRQKISDQIDSTENGVNAIKRALSAEEQKTVTLIRQYITRARDALKNDDLDGATNLGNKAQQLLQELTKQ